jgi:ribosomal protein L40E
LALLAPWEWAIIGLIVGIVIIVVFVIFWEGFVVTLRRMGTQKPQDKGPLPTADYTKYVWDGESIGAPPAKKTVVLPYDGPERVSLSFFIDLTSSRNCYLDPVRPIRINGEVVSIKDLPGEPEKLRAIKRESVDVTKYVRTGAQGIPNEFEVNYITKGRLSRFRSTFGKMTLYLSVTMPKVSLAGIGRDTKFCMSCATTIPASAPFCWKCGVAQEAFSGTSTKTCRTCSTEIPATAVYCSNCGTAQPKESIPALEPPMQAPEAAQQPPLSA